MPIIEEKEVIEKRRRVFNRVVKHRKYTERSAVSHGHYAEKSLTQIPVITPLIITFSRGALKTLFTDVTRREAEDKKRELPIASNRRGKRNFIIHRFSEYRTLLGEKRFCVSEDKQFMLGEKKEKEEKECDVGHRVTRALRYTLRYT